MHTDPYIELARITEQLGRRRLPWLADPRLGGCTVDELVQTIRNYRADAKASDRVVRALVEIGTDEADAMTVLIHALAGSLRSKLKRVTSAEYRSTVLGDLTAVVLESIAANEFTRQDHLVRRYLARAHNRSARAQRLTRTRGTKNLVTVEVVGPDRLRLVQDQQYLYSDDVASLAVDRADLAAFAVGIDRAIESGQLSLQSWTAFRDHRLGRIFTRPERPASVQDRAAAHRAAKSIEPFATEVLGQDAA